MPESITTEELKRLPSRAFLALATRVVRRVITQFSKRLPEERKPLYAGIDLVERFIFTRADLQTLMSESVPIIGNITGLDAEGNDSKIAFAVVGVLAALQKIATSDIEHAVRDVETAINTAISTSRNPIYALNVARIDFERLLTIDPSCFNSGGQMLESRQLGMLWPDTFDFEGPEIDDPTLARDILTGKGTSIEEIEACVIHAVNRASGYSNATSVTITLHEGINGSENDYEDAMISIDLTVREEIATAEIEWHECLSMVNHCRFKIISLESSAPETGTASAEANLTREAKVDPRAGGPTVPPLTVYLDPGEAPQKLITELLLTLSAYYESLGGSGLQLISDEQRLLVTEEIPQ